MANAASRCASRAGESRNCKVDEAEGGPFSEDVQRRCERSERCGCCGSKVGAKGWTSAERVDPADKDYWGNEALTAFAKLSAQLSEHGFTPGSAILAQ